MTFNRLYLMAHPGINKAITSGEIEGVPFKLLDGDILPGDTYIAERNSGLKLLTCRSNNHEDGWIVPVEDAYCYDTNECIRIELQV